MNEEDVVNVIAILAILVVFITPIISFAIRYMRYKNSSYYKITQNPYSFAFGDKGTYGEYSLYTYLRHFEMKGCRFLFNLYVPKGGGRTSEIDIVMIHPKCLFVIECKNYSGWIFGNENNEYWIQVLPIDYGESCKTQFYNPIKQNAMHIRAIRRYINDAIPIHSVIAFSDECTFKDITVRSNVIVNYFSGISRDISLVVLELDDCSIDVDKIYNDLVQYTNADERTKLRHILNSRNIDDDIIPSSQK